MIDFNITTAGSFTRIETRSQRAREAPGSLFFGAVEGRSPGTWIALPRGPRGANSLISSLEEKGYRLAFGASPWGGAGSRARYGG